MERNTVKKRRITVTTARNTVTRGKHATKQGGTKS
jgi:hypothetical protein